MGISREMKEESWEELFELRAMAGDSSYSRELMDALDELKKGNRLRYVDLIPLQKAIELAYRIGCNSRDNDVRDAYDQGKLDAEDAEKASHDYDTCASGDNSWRGE